MYPVHDHMTAVSNSLSLIALKAGIHKKNKYRGKIVRASRDVTVIVRNLHSSRFVHLSLIQQLT